MRLMKGNQTARAQKPDVASRRSPARSRYRILVAEENPQLRLRYAFALVRPGYDVDVAEDGAAAWEALQAKRYHLLITENDLPRLTGVDLV